MTDKKNVAERLVATVHVPLSLRYFNDFAQALQNAVGEKLYLRGSVGHVFSVVSLGEPLPQDDAADDEDDEGSDEDDEGSDEDDIGG